MANTVRMKLRVATGSGRRKGWIKHVTGIDTSQQAGYSLKGNFINDGVEVDLPVGAVIVSVEPQGSVKNGWKEGVLSMVTADAELEEFARGHWQQDFLTLRDLIANQIELQTGTAVINNPLAGYSLEELVAEIERRVADKPEPIQAEISTG